MGLLVGVSSAIAVTWPREGVWPPLMAAGWSADKRSSSVCVLKSDALQRTGVRCYVVLRSVYRLGRACRDSGVEPQRQVAPVVFIARRAATTQW